MTKLNQSKDLWRARITYKSVSASRQLSYTKASFSKGDNSQKVMSLKFPQDFQKALLGSLGLSLSVAHCIYNKRRSFVNELSFLGLMSLVF